VPSVLMRENRTCRRRCSAKSQPAGTRRYALPAAAEDEPPGAVEHAAGAVAAVGELAESAGEAEPESAGTGSTPAVEPGDTEPDTAGLEEIVAGDPGPPRGRAAVRFRAAPDRGDLGGAAYCNNGHFDDLEARFCAVCGISMNQQTLRARPGPRPPFGLLALDGGDLFQRAPTT